MLLEGQAANLRLNRWSSTSRPAFSRLCWLLPRSSRTAGGARESRIGSAHVRPVRSRPSVNWLAGSLPRCPAPVCRSRVSSTRESQLCGLIFGCCMQARITLLNSCSLNPQRPCILAAASPIAALDRVGEPAARHHWLVATCLPSHNRTSRLYAPLLPSHNTSLSSPHSTRPRSSSRVVGLSINHSLTKRFYVAAEIND